MPERPVRLLLINPAPPDSFWSFRWAMENVTVKQRAPNPPLGLATLAALCPSYWSVAIADEAVDPVPWRPAADVIGVCGMGVQHGRQRELLAYYRGLGYYTVAGGSYASLCPERLEDIADCVVTGEAEHIWPQFCRDYEAGRPQPRYTEQGNVEMAAVPTPRFDLLDLSRYGTASLQFSRGCPYRCDFCDIIVMFGRRPRTKSPEQIGRELDALRDQGAGSAFFVDDNLIGHKKDAKELLRYLVDYQKRHGYPFTFGTEASLNLAEDAELLELFREAGFAWVFLGIETPDVQSLKAAGKTQNTKTDLLEAVRIIYGHGIEVFAGFIVGFDDDSPAAFEQQYRFIVDAGIQVAMVGLLTAVPRTPLYERLASEGRLRLDIQPGDNTRGQTNVLPAGMSYATMVDGYKALYRRLFSDRGIASRIRNKTRYLRRPIAVGGSEPLATQLKHLWRAVRRGIAPGGIRRWWCFGATLWSPPRLWPIVIKDWVLGLSMRHYADRHFREPPQRAWRSAGRTLDRLRRRCRPAFERGAIAVEVQQLEQGPNLVLTLRDAVESRCLRRAQRHLLRMLRRSHTSVTLRIECIDGLQRKPMGRLLTRLGRHRERVAIQLSEEASAQWPMDWWNPLLILAPTTTEPDSPGLKPGRSPSAGAVG